MTTHTHLLTYPESFLPRRHRAPWGIQGPLFDGAADGGAGGQGGNGGNGGGAAGAGAGAGAGGAGGEGGEGEVGEVVKMTKAELDELIAGRVGQALSQAEKKRTNVPKETVEELERLRKADQQRQREELERKGKYEEALKAQEESIRKPYEEEKKTFLERIDGVTSRLREALVTNKLLAAASAGNAYNAEQVVQLNERFVKLDDDFNPTVVDKDGNPRFVAGKPMTPEQLIEEFLRANPNHVKAKAGQGGGAGGGKHVVNGDVSPLEALELEVAKLGDEIERTGSTRAVALHLAKSKELAELKRKQAA